MKLKKIFVAFCAILMSTSLFACGDKNEEYIYKYSNENAALSALHYASQLTIMSVGSQMEEKDISSFKILSGNSNVQENYGNGRVYMTYQYTIRSEKIKVSQSFAVVNYGIVNIRGTESSVISDPKTEIACPNFNIDESGYINIKIVNKVYQEYLKTGKEDIREDIDIESSDGCFRYEINDEKTVTLYAGSKIENFTTITIPNTVKIGGRYYDVTAIGRNAFYEHSLPGYPNRNSKIKKVIFKNGSKLESIGDYAFYKCSSLTSIVIPSSVTSIGYGAFSDCSSLTSIVIPNSVISIGEHAFSGCNSLQYNEYGNCYYLWNDKNPYLVLVKAKDINITSATINENTKFIHSSAFSGCSSLTSIVIPISVTSIGSSAFYNCIS
ncbi:MAG: leucine-rich repeat domain-containing protein, partial [Erysipelotrichales bacterium]|nr:leucine-rich repeat domain-containing protein [Erysipelotrichales bacterium]